MLLRALHKAPRAAPSCARAFSAGVDDGPAATNLVWSELLSTDERKAILEKSSRAKHAGCTVWLTGLSGSGKSTVGALLETKLLAKGVHAYRLDGDNIRMGLNKDRAFSEEDREENIRRIGEVSALFSDAGIVSICAFISPYRKSRRAARACHSALKQPFIEVREHIFDSSTPPRFTHAVTLGAPNARRRLIIARKALSALC